MKEKKRIEWLDYAKVGIMLLVILDHLGPEDRVLSAWITSWHMPAFFLISGVFTSIKERGKVFFKDNAERLLLPVLLWHVVGSVVWLPVLAYHTNPSDFWGEYIALQGGFFLGKSMGFGWFMIALFWCRVLYYYLMRLPLWLQYAIAFAVFPTIAYLLREEPRAPYYVYQSLMAFPAYFLGIALRAKILAWHVRPLISLVICLLALWVTTMLSPDEVHPSYNALEYGYGPHITYLQALAGSVFIITFAQVAYGVLGSRTFLNTLGTGTIVLLLCQPGFIFLFKVVYRLIFGSHLQGAYYDTVSAFVASALIMLMTYPIILFVDRYIPRLNGRKSKA